MRCRSLCRAHAQRRRRWRWPPGWAPSNASAASTPRWPTRRRRRALPRQIAAPHPRSSCRRRLLGSRGTAPAAAARACCSRTWRPPRRRGLRATRLPARAWQLRAPRCAPPPRCTPPTGATRSWPSGAAPAAGCRGWTRSASFRSTAPSSARPGRAGASASPPPPPRCPSASCWPSTPTPRASSAPRAGCSPAWPKSRARCCTATCASTTFSCAETPATTRTRASSTWEARIC